MNEHSKRRDFERELAALKPMAPTEAIENRVRVELTSARCAANSPSKLVRKASASTDQAMLVSWIVAATVLIAVLAWLLWPSDVDRQAGSDPKTATPNKLDVGSDNIQDTADQEAKSLAQQLRRSYEPPTWLSLTEALRESSGNAQPADNDAYSADDQEWLPPLPPFRNSQPQSYAVLGGL